MSSELLKKAIELSDNGKKEDARNILKIIVEEEPKNELAWLWYIDTFLSNSEQIRITERAIKSLPESQRLQNVLSKLNTESHNETNQNVDSRTGSVRLKKPIEPAKKNQPSPRASTKELVMAFVFIGIVCMVVILLKSSLREMVFSFLEAPKLSPTITEQESHILIPTPEIIPTFTPQPSPTPIPLLSGPARKYVPSSTVGMPSDFVAFNIEEFDIESGGSVYKISYSPYTWTVNDSRILTQVNYTVYLGDSIEHAIANYNKLKDNYSVDDNWSYYSWVEKTELFGKYSDTGGFSGRRKTTAYGESGRLIRANNLVVLIMVEGKGGQEIMPTLEKELIFYVGLVTKYLPQ